MRANKRLVTASRTTRDRRGCSFSTDSRRFRAVINKLFSTPRIRNRFIEAAYSQDGCGGIAADAFS
jgi:hypothetical protein